ncbi:hypothetical protein ASD72_07410 [Pseudoxanthomonas sp. Root630]|nr:hypothetical protein ASD72_07410 [Pseudoxanthomonas sp. Root630]
MGRTLVNALLLGFVALMGGCAIVPDPNESLDNVALIRGVTEDQSMWMAGLTAVFVGHVDSIYDARTGQRLEAPTLRRQRNLFYVPPGTYVVRMDCNGGGFVVSLNFPEFTAKAGSEYQLRCSGNLRNITPEIIEVPHPVR